MFSAKSLLLSCFLVSSLVFGTTSSVLFKVDHYEVLNQLIELRSQPVTKETYDLVLQNLEKLPEGPQRQYEKELRMFFAEKAYEKQFYQHSLELVSGIDFTGTQRYFQQQGMKIIDGLVDQGYTLNPSVVDFAIKFPEYFKVAQLKKFNLTQEQVLKVHSRLAVLTDLQSAAWWSEYCHEQGIDSAPFWVSESRRYMKRKELENAKSAARKALARDPFLTSATVLLAEIYQKEEDYPRAMRTLDPVVRSRVAFATNPKHISNLWLELHRKENPDVTLVDLIANEHIPDTMVPSQLRWQLAFDAYRKKEYAKAMRWLEGWEPTGYTEKAQRLYWMYRSASQGGFERSKAEKAKLQCMTEYPDTVYSLFLAQYHGMKDFHPLYQAGYTQPVLIPPQAKTLVKDGFAKWFAEDLKCELKVAKTPEKTEMSLQAAALFRDESLYRDSLNAVSRADVPLVDPQKGLNLTMLSLAYPRPFYHHVSDVTKEKQVEQAYVFAIMREESSFEPKAVSSSGARGLMQLMPKTAAGIAKQLKTEAYTVDKLFRPETNITFGTSYLEYLHKRFNGNPLWMASGYNAGPNITAKWVKAWGDLPMDEQLELIPYDETNAYAKRVLRSFWIYQEVLKSSTMELSEAGSSLRK